MQGSTSWPSSAAAGATRRPTFRPSMRPTSSWLGSGPINRIERSRCEARELLHAVLLTGRFGLLETPFQTGKGDEGNRYHK